MESQNEVVQKHPAALYWLFMSEMWERFSYYGMRALLILYLIGDVAKGGLAWKEGDATSLYALYLGMSYILTLAGGIVADQFLGFRKTVILGGLMMAAAQFSLSAGSAMGSLNTFYLGLILLVIGNGFFKPNISGMVGQFYPDESPLKDSAYTIFYMGINMGAFFGALVCGYLGEEIGWQYGFGAAGVGMLLGVLIFYIGQSNFNEVGIRPNSQENKSKTLEREPLTSVEIQRLSVAVILSFFSIVFWASFEQAGSSMNIFAAKYTDRMIGGFEVPASWFQSVNAFFIFLLAPVFSMIWIVLERNKINPNGPVKFAIGLLLVAAGFVALVIGAATIKQGADSAQVSMIWLVIAYMLHTMGELCISPVGLSFINKLSPAYLFGTMFSVWFVATGMGSYLGGYIAGIIGDSENYTISEFFMIVVIFPASAGLLLLLISPLLKKMMHGVR